MQTRCKRLSVMMRISTAAVTALQQVDYGPALPDAISSLNQQNMDLLAALDKLTAKEVEPASLSSQHVCFITDFISLVAPLISTLRRLEKTASTSQSPLQATGFDHLWSLLISSCRAFTLWPMMWPVGHQLAFTPLITTLDSLMSLLLLVTRTRNTPWLGWESIGPLGRKTQAYTLLFPPMATMFNLAQSPPSIQEQELQTMPSLFFAKLCCLSCELLSSLPSPSTTVQHVAAVSAVWATGGSIVPQSAVFFAAPLPGDASATGIGGIVTAVAARIAATRDLEINPFASHPETCARCTSSYDLFFFHLAACTSNFLRETVTARTTPRNKLFLHPAVILVMKTSLTLRAGIRDKADLVQFCESTVMAILTHLVNFSVESNNTVQQGAGRQGYSLGSPGTDMFARMRPRVVVSDDCLLRTLCRRMCVEPSLVHNRLGLMMALLNCWSATKAELFQSEVPFPVPNGEEQVCGIVTLVHYFSSKVVEWMQEELEKRRQRHQPQPGGIRRVTQPPPPPVVVSKRQLLLEQAKYAVQLACDMRCIFPFMDAVEGVEDGTRRQDVVIRPEILKLRAWMRSPGMLYMHEALLRSDTRPQLAGHVFNSVSVTLALLNYKLDPQQLDTVLPACLSLAATIRKIMHPATHRVFDRYSRGQIPQVFSTLQVSTLTCMHIQLINIMNKALRAESCSSGSSMGSIRSSLPNAAATSGTTIVAHGTASPRAAIRVLTAAERKVFYHRVQAVMLVCVVQLCHFRAESGEGPLERAGRPSEWVQVIFGRLENPGNGLLKFLQNRLLRLRRNPAGAQQEVAPQWEQYSCDNFEGRMLPGCCYLGCTNLTGVAEAALPMLRCGGCERARYCGAACQRGAWLEGGHSTVCGRK